MAQDLQETWTAECVEARLVNAFKLLPGASIYSTGRRLQSGVFGAPDIITDTLSWAGRFVPDQAERLALLTWARCMAARESFAEHVRLSGKSRSTEEDRRRRAVARIVACLISEQRGLDNRKTGIGASASTAEADPVLASA